MGANKSALLPVDQVELICKETGSIEGNFSSKNLLFRLGFTPRQLQRLYVRFQELDRRKPKSGYLTREDLLHIREVALNPLGERLVDVLIKDHGQIFFSVKSLIEYSRLS